MTTSLRDSILAEIQRRPTRFKDITSPSKLRRRKVRAIIDTLAAEGLIKQVQMARVPYFVPSSYERPNDFTDQRILAGSKETVDGCLEWQGYVDERCGPMLRVDDIPKAIRRIVWERSHPKLKFNQVIKGKCENEKCIAAGCLAMASRHADIIGRPKSMLAGKKIAEARRRTAKLTMEIAREIRASSESAPTLALIYGVSKSTIADIRQYRRWKEYDALFGGLTRKAA